MATTPCSPHVASRRVAGPRSATRRLCPRSSRISSAMSAGGGAADADEKTRGLLRAALARGRAGAAPRLMREHCLAPERRPGGIVAAPDARARGARGRRARRARRRAQRRARRRRAPVAMLHARHRRRFRGAPRNPPRAVREARVLRAGCGRAVRPQADPAPPPPAQAKTRETTRAAAKRSSAPSSSSRTPSSTPMTSPRR